MTQPMKTDTVSLESHSLYVYCCDSKIKAKMRVECHLGMADVQVAIRFRGESGHDLATSSFQVCLQLSCCVGNAHLTTSGFRAEGHHLVYLHTHIPSLEIAIKLYCSALPYPNLVLACICKVCMYSYVRAHHATLQC